MNDLNLDKYLNITNKEKIKQGLDSYIPLYPMLRIENDKLYVAVMITDENDNVWDKNSKIKAEYWVLIDIDSDKILEFNDTKEISKYTVKKTFEYKNMLLNDIKHQELPLQKKLSTLLNNEISINGEKIKIEDYLISNLEEDIKIKIDELVNLLVQSQYGSLTFYYDNIFSQIIEEYKTKKIIDKDKIKLCIEIMNNYYDGVIGIDNFFNV